MAAPWENYKSDDSASTAAPADASQQPAGPWANYAPGTSPPAAPAASPTDQGDTLQVYNPFGENFNTHIPLSANVQNTLAGAGKAFSDTAAGVHQIALHIGNHLGLVSDDDLQKNQAEIDDTKKRDAALMATKAGQLGNAIGQGAELLAVPGVAEGGILATTLGSAALGAMQATTSDESRLKNAGEGAASGAIGGVIGKVGGALLGGFGGVVGKNAAAVNTLREAGIPLTRSQETGSPLAQAIEGAAEYTSNAPKEFADAQKKALTTAVLSHVGEKPNPVTGVATADPTTMFLAKQRITGNLDAVIDRNPQITVDQHLMNDLAYGTPAVVGASGQVITAARPSILHDLTRTVGASDQAPVRKILADLRTNWDANKVSGAAGVGDRYIDGDVLQTAMSDLSKVSKTTPAAAEVAGDFRDALNDALNRQLVKNGNFEDAGILATARQQYRVMKQIEPAVDPVSHEIDLPKMLSSLKAKSNRSSLLYGEGGDQALNNLITSAHAVIPNAVGGPTALKQMGSKLLGAQLLAQGEWGKAAMAGTAAKATNMLAGVTRAQGLGGKLLSGGLVGDRAALQSAAKNAANAARVGIAGDLGTQFGLAPNQNQQQ